jgi:hypothetical protein
MKSNELPTRLNRNRYMNDYLIQLQQLVGPQVSEADLTTAEFAVEVEKARATRSEATCGCVYLPFEARLLDGFRNFVSLLYAKNDGPIYIWTEETRYCGALKVQSISQVNFGFDYEINDNGLIAFLAENLEDRLLLMFGEEGDGLELTVETEGPNWLGVVDSLKTNGLD